ncbi:MAG: hypothetical protein A3K19_13490 [Lentisphaerae bacterium RIFOXYB12_FULL_65_16]|nr:MAG: hypothetical protein A3K18_29010 [Lentisphaerae bacterium RIFOXYA12_64_32]OGV86306.1 MAG: hypothetical protein A3K19_13490 [Lentisphaerae bacterium RIFOXYB12_FULL_65_16]
MLLRRAATCVALWALTLALTGTGQTLPNLEFASLNLAGNPGFEALNEDGWPAGWSMPETAFMLSTLSPRDGRFCLRWTNSDPEHYVRCATGLSLQAGKRYDLEAWVVTEGLAGEGGGATVRIEWVGKDGKVLGGVNPAGLTGTSDGWKRLRITTDPIPKNVESASLICVVPKGCTGAAFWDDILVRPYYPPLVTGMVTDAYQHTTAGGTVLVKAGLNLPDWELAPDTVIAELSVLDSRGGVVCTAPPAKLEATEVVFSLDTAPLPVGEFQLSCDVRNPDGTKSGKASCGLVRVTELRERMVRIDGSNRLLVSGEPFFPLGVWWNEVNPWLLETYCKGPFNCIVLPGSRPAAQFDMVAARGLKIICSLQDFYAGGKDCPAALRSEADEQSVLEAVVTALRDKPAVLAWQLAHQPAPELLPRVAAHREWVEKLDSSRPLWVVAGRADELPLFVSQADVLGLGTYPVPQSPCGDVLRDTLLALKSGLGCRAVWMLPQAFDWAAYKTDPKEKKNCRAPTLEEMRSMAWQSIAAGATGLIFWSWQDLWKMDRTVAEGGQALSREPFADRWRDLCQVADEIRRYVPVLTSLEPYIAPDEVDLSPAVALRSHGKDGQTYIFAVNSRNEPTTGRLHFKGNPTVTVEFGKADPPSRQGQIYLSFAPLEVKVLRLSVPPSTAAAVLPTAIAPADQPVQQ